MKRMIIAILMGIIGAPTTAGAAQELASNDVAISASAIVIPAGRVLLIKRETFRGALVFGETEERPEGLFAKYQAYRFGDEGIHNISEGEVIFKQVSSFGFFHKGIGSLLGPPLKLDNFRLCASPAGPEPHLRTHAIVYFWSKPTIVDQKVNLAATPWRSVREANPEDPRVKWFAYDEKREPKIIRIDKIWD
jgi:hypothetical protein